MKMTTLCYLERDGQYLMLHRVKKENDLNHDNWVGVGGKFEPDESPDECLLREVREETGLELTDYRPRGIVSFISDKWETEYMFLYTAHAFTGRLHDCDEGELAWIPREQVPSLPLWEGDRIFLKLLAADAPYFSLKLVYEDEKLVRAVLDGREMK